VYSRARHTRASSQLNLAVSRDTPFLHSVTNKDIKIFQRVLHARVPVSAATACTYNLLWTGCRNIISLFRECLNEASEETRPQHLARIWLGSVSLYLSLCTFFANLRLLLSSWWLPGNLSSRTLDLFDERRARLAAIPNAYTCLTALSVKYAGISRARKRCG